MADFVKSYGLHILNRGGKFFDLRQLTADHVVAFYFSNQAHGRHFTPMLKKFVETLQSFGEHTLKVIFVSSDQAEHDMWKYMYDSHGDWLALDFNCKDGKLRLERKYQVSSIPQLVVVNPAGMQAVADARGEVMSAVHQSTTHVLKAYLGWKTAVGAGPSAPRPVIPARPPCNELPPGVRVRVRGLTGQPEHNGLEGVVAEYDAGRQRYVVQLGEKSLALRAANLLQLVAVRMPDEAPDGDCDQEADSVGDREGVADSGDAGDAGVREGGDGDAGESESARAKPRWREADVSDFDDASGELMLSFRGEVKRARLDDADGPVLLAGTRVVVHGLKAESARQWNERMGEVIEFDEEKGRYLVQVSPSEQLKLRPQNLRLAPL